MVGRKCSPMAYVLCFVYVVLTLRPLCWAASPQQQNKMYVHTPPPKLSEALCGRSLQVSLDEARVELSEGEPKVHSISLGRKL